METSKPFLLGGLFFVVACAVVVCIASAVFALLSYIIIIILYYYHYCCLSLLFVLCSQLQSTIQIYLSSIKMMRISVSAKCLSMVVYLCGFLISFLFLSFLSLYRLYAEALLPPDLWARVSSSLLPWPAEPSSTCPTYPRMRASTGPRRSTVRNVTERAQTTFIGNWWHADTDTDTELITCTTQPLSVSMWSVKLSTINTFLCSYPFFCLLSSVFCVCLWCIMIYIV